ncbi:MAG: nucleoside triphosphate pyrophosphohydrolase [Rhodomicrobiaceae bacterium]
MRLADLLSLMAVLRDPARGCPWDREQDFASIAPYTIEEAYEVADAIARGNMGDLKDELGDLLLQVVYHAQMAGEAGEFDFASVADAITRKMIRRHPHVFGSEETRSAIDVKGLWNRIKAEEARGRRERAGAESEPDSVLDGVPLTFPAMTRAVKIQKKAASVGFDWTEPVQILSKVREETDELEQEIKAGNQVEIEDELGDLLFVLANLSRRLKVDPEAAVRAANAKFERRFRHIEQRLRAEGKLAEDTPLEELELLWLDAKRQEKTAAE